MAKPIEKPEGKGKATRKEDDGEKKNVEQKVEEKEKEKEKVAPQQQQQQRQQSLKQRSITTGLMVIVVAVIFYLVVPVLLSGLPSNPVITAYIEEARLANGKRDDADKAEQVLLTTLCNMRKEKTTYILQVLAEDGTLEKFKYRIRPTTCAHITISMGVKPNHFDSAKLFLYEVGSLSWGLGARYDKVDTQVALARTV